MNKLYTVVLGLAALAIIVPAQATAPCYTTSTPTATIPDTAHQLGGDLYVNNDLCQTDPVNPCVFSIWVYQETNGIPGEQRGDEVVNDVANCTDGTSADTDLE